MTGCIGHYTTTGYTIAWPTQTKGIGIDPGQAPTTSLHPTRPCPLPSPHLSPLAPACAPGYRPWPRKNRSAACSATHRAAVTAVGSSSPESACWSGEGLSSPPTTIIFCEASAAASSEEEGWTWPGSRPAITRGQRTTLQMVATKRDRVGCIYVMPTPASQAALPASRKKLPEAASMAIGRTGGATVFHNHSTSVHAPQAPRILAHSADVGGVDLHGRACLLQQRPDVALH